MRKTILRILLSFMLISAISFSAVSVPVYAATKAEKKEEAKQKKAAEKTYKYYKKTFKNTADLKWKVQKKKTGKTYTFTLTSWTKKYTASTIHRWANNNDPGYLKTLDTFENICKVQYKNAKYYGLKKPTVILIWKSADNITIVKAKNGYLIDDDE